MNRHSILYGNDPAKGDGSQLTRGQRVFCSDRGQREGCGRTFSIFLADILPRHTVDAGFLARLLIDLLAGATVKATAEKLCSPFPLETLYSLLGRLRHRLDALRSCLCRQRPVPPSSQTDPLFQTIEHLQSIWKSGALGEFQLFFQQPFLG